VNYIALLTGLGLGILWIISLSTHSAASWYTWLVFVAGVVLVVAALLDMRRERGKTTP
jgi:hypothetical protein